MLPLKEMNSFCQLYEDIEHIDNKVHTLQLLTEVIRYSVPDSVVKIGIVPRITKSIIQGLRQTVETILEEIEIPEH